MRSEVKSYKDKLPNLYKMFSLIMILENKTYSIRFRENIEKTDFVVNYEMVENINDLWKVVEEFCNNLEIKLDTSNEYISYEHASYRLSNVIERMFKNNYIDGQKYYFSYHIRRNLYSNKLENIYQKFKNGIVPFAVFKPELNNEPSCHNSLYFDYWFDCADCCDEPSADYETEYRFPRSINLIDVVESYDKRNNELFVRSSEKYLKMYLAGLVDYRINDKSPFDNIAYSNIIDERINENNIDDESYLEYLYYTIFLPISIYRPIIISLHKKYKNKEAYTDYFDNVSIDEKTIKYLYETIIKLNDFALKLAESLLYEKLVDDKERLAKKIRAESEIYSVKFALKFYKRENKYFYEMFKEEIDKDIELFNSIEDRSINELEKISEDSFSLSKKYKDYEKEFIEKTYPSIDELF